jgi:Chitobiase/beta-hexosaminidase C-terminal domain
VASADSSKHVYMNAVTVEYTCSTTNSTVYYTADGSKPDETSLTYTAPIKWVQAGETVFTAVACAPGFHRSRLLTSSVEVEAPDYDTHPIAQQPLDAIAPAVTVSALEVMKRSSNGQSNGQIVRGKCAVLANPAAHFLVVAAAASASSKTNISDSGSSAILSDIKQLAVQFEPERPQLVLLKGETYTEAGKRLKLQEREAQWQLTKQSGCQVSVYLLVIT